MYIICPAQAVIDNYGSAINWDQLRRRTVRQAAQEEPPPPLPPKPKRGVQIAKKVASQSRKTSPGGGPGHQTHLETTPSSAPRPDGLRAMVHPVVWPNVKNHVNNSLALVKNLTDFTQELSQMYDHHAEELQLLVANYRKKNAEFRKDRTGPNCMLEMWESMLQGVEADSAGHSEVAAVFSRQVSRQTLEKSFHRKLQARKLLQHRESLDAIVTKAEDHLSKCRQEYKGAWLAASQGGNSPAALATYLDAHNTYVVQLHATNAILDSYSKQTLPDILQELEDVYTDLCKTMAESLALGSEILSNRLGGQSRRWCNIWSECKGVDPLVDTSALVRNSNMPAQPHSSHRLRLFTPPQDANHQEAMGGSATPMLKNELVSDRLATLQIPQRYEGLCEEANQLQAQAHQLQDNLQTMGRLQQRSLESQLYNKVNELQEDISKKRYELKTLHLNIAANRAQRELFSSKLEVADGNPSGGQDRKMSNASSGSMKSKWLKAFKSLKTPPPSANPSKEPDKRDAKDIGVAGDHQFQEYTYKKITPCDVCSQVLRGHTRQGLKCRICKLNVHLDCQERVGKCQTKSRLLRRQKSSSEIETRVTPPQPTPQSNSDIEQGDYFTNQDSKRSPDAGFAVRSKSVTFQTPDEHNIAGYETNVDSTYHVLKTANEMSGPNPSPLPISGSMGSNMGAIGAMSANLSAPGPPPVSKGNIRRPATSSHATSSDFSGAHQRRKKLFGMKSFVFGHRSNERASSLPETDECTIGENSRLRPFGQPLVLSSPSPSSSEPPNRSN